MMNEILKKRIEEAADGYSAEITPAYSNGYFERYQTADAFEAGAEYAISHQFISVDEALPEDDEYVIALINGVPVIAKGIHVKENLNDITHWMTIPKLNHGKTE